MAGKISKNKKPTKTTEAERAAKRKVNTAQIFFAIFAIILILSMVLSAVSKF
jgi:predicted nucleic acid-binding Zn ribbon protein